MAKSKSKANAKSEANAEAKTKLKAKATTILPCIDTTQFNSYRLFACIVLCMHV